MHTHTIRSRGSLVIWSIGAGAGLLALIDLALGDPGALVHAGAPILLALWVLGIVLARPVIRYDADGLVVVNPLVVTEMGWGAVEAVVRRTQVVVVLADGRRVTAWASPTVRRQRHGQEPAPDWALTQLDTAWEQARLDNRTRTDVRRHLDVPVAAAGAVLALAAVAGLLL
ncbi:hypothetical protein [Nocardioides montaniterrae]